MKKTFSIVLALMLALGLLSTAGAENMYISVISKGEQHAYWQTVRKGCEDAAKEYGVDMYYYGPETENDIGPQVDALKGELAKNPVAIALAALDTESVMTELKECIDKGIPVIGFDSGVPNAPEGSIYATASTDNVVAAAYAADMLFETEGYAEKLAAGTPENPVVIGVLSQAATGTSIVDRTTGFVNRMKELAGDVGTVSVQGHEVWAAPVDGAGIIIHVEVGATTLVGDVQNAANALLNQDNLISIFPSNEGAVTGLLAATADGSEFAPGARYDGVLVAGFDASRAQKNAVRQGWFIGSVSQNPYQIGYLAVELAVKAANGEEVADVDTGFVWYNAENVDSEEMAMLVYD